MYSWRAIKRTWSKEYTWIKRYLILAFKHDRIYHQYLKLLHGFQHVSGELYKAMQKNSALESELQRLRPVYSMYSDLINRIKHIDPNSILIPPKRERRHHIPFRIVIEHSLQSIGFHTPDEIPVAIEVYHQAMHWIELKFRKDEYRRMVHFIMEISKEGVPEDQIVYTISERAWQHIPIEDFKRFLTQEVVRQITEYFTRKIEKDTIT